jgi:hypothetical protein
MQHKYWTEVNQLQQRLDQVSCAVINQPRIHGRSNVCRAETPETSSAARQDRCGDDFADTAISFGGSPC